MEKGFKKTDHQKKKYKLLKDTKQCLTALIKQRNGTKFGISMPFLQNEQKIQMTSMNRQLK